MRLYSGLAATVMLSGCLNMGPARVQGKFTPPVQRDSSQHSAHFPETEELQDLHVVETEVENSEKRESCNSLNIGLVGASNTVDEYKGVKVTYRESLGSLVEYQCPYSEVYLYAEGGRGPRGQKYLVGYLLENHQDLDYVILNPSENEMARDDVETYTSNALDLARMVKEKDSGIRVVMLTNTPSKGHSPGKPWGWTEELQKKKDQFNQDLLERKLGHPELIDFSVDTYSATEDPLGSDECGKYCVKDKIHFNTEGMKAVADVIIGEVFTGDGK